jgi:hypothetical protein
MANSLNYNLFVKPLNIIKILYKQLTVSFIFATTDSFYSKTKHAN